MLKVGGKNYEWFRVVNGFTDLIYNECLTQFQNALLSGSTRTVSTLDIALSVFKSFF